MKELELTNSINDKNHGGTFSNMVYNEFKKTRDQNLFEEVIDDLMMTKYSDDQETIDYIKSSNLKDKRLKILSLIDDSETPRFLKLKEKIEGNKVSKVTHLIETLEDLRIFIKYGSVQNKTLGEIMTPIEELAKPMVKLVEKYDSDFWKDPTNKVLDSSAGLGTFLILSLIKFMKGLENWEPDVEKRYKHIVENCLYYGELQSRNVFFWLCLIDPYDEYTTNTYWGSFLEEGFDNHMKNVWGVESFELVIMNPPYQQLKDTDKNKNSKNPKTQPLWHLFVQKSLFILKKGAYMIMVHPGGWRDIKGKFKETQNLLKEKKILELHMFSFKSGLDMFKSKTNFDYYILKNEYNKFNITEIHCENGDIENMNIIGLDYIPGENISYINSLFAKDDDKIRFISNSTYHTQQGQKSGLISKTKSDIYNLPVVYMVSYKDIPTFTYAKNTRFEGMDKGHFGLSKVIWAQGSSGVIIDECGDFGMSEFSGAILDNIENLQNIKKAIKSDKFIRDVMLFKNGLGNKYNNKVISMLKKDFWKEFI